MDLFDEIKQDVRQEKFAKLWKEYCNYVYAAIAAIIIGTSANVWWKDHVRAGHEESAALYMQAMDELDAGNYEKSSEILTLIEEEGRGGYIALAKLRQGHILTLLNKKDEAATAFAAISEDSDIDEGFRTIAALHASKLLVDLGKAQEAEQKLAVLAQDGASFKNTAIYLQVANAIEKNQPQQAVSLLNSIQEDKNAPVSAKIQAQQMILLLGLADEKPATEETLANGS